MYVFNSKFVVNFSRNRRLTYGALFRIQPFIVMGEILRSDCWWRIDTSFIGIQSDKLVLPIELLETIQWEYQFWGTEYLDF